VNTQLSTRKNYDHAIEVVKKVIHAWDPYCLFKTGSPEDEFDGETASVVRQIPRIKSEYDAAIVISKTFSSSFDPKEFKIEACTEVGKKLYRNLVESGILIDD